mmetsp:Transcript_7142/g.8041  ORF Transcript_7142/g.8041 Transcript_7142/m.8041 type:complete len:129 (-) Transcript_7142:26-412(-)
MQEPSYKNIIYHDTNSQLGVENRYVSENKEIGGDQKHKHKVKTTISSPRGTLINPTYKAKSSLMTIFPSYGVMQGAKSIFTTTNQQYEKSKNGEKLDVPDRAHFRQVYNMKTYMEEMLKAKNMRGEKK